MARCRLPRRNVGNGSSFLGAATVSGTDLRRAPEQRPVPWRRSPADLGAWREPRRCRPRWVLATPRHRPTCCRPAARRSGHLHPGHRRHGGGVRVALAADHHGTERRRRRPREGIAKAGNVPRARARQPRRDHKRVRQPGQHHREARVGQCRRVHKHNLGVLSGVLEQQVEAGRGGHAQRIGRWRAGGDHGEASASGTPPRRRPSRSCRRARSRHWPHPRSRQAEKLGRGAAVRVVEVDQHDAMSNLGRPQASQVLTSELPPTGSGPVTSSVLAWLAFAQTPAGRRSLEPAPG